ncbi:MAG: c-type cytochrome [Candidatus Rokubacteria bacterium]|nr:c-type cytochrome [Candidatus Rokubacteria bacterium]
MKTFAAVALAALIGLCWNVGAGADAASNGERLFIQKGCIGCHGTSGRGGAGPDLAGTALGIEDFLKQLRAPRAQMPPFPASAVSESEAREIHTFLKTIPAPPPRVSAAPPQGPQGPASCVECHRKHNPTLVAQYESSAMFRPGRQNPRIPVTTPEANSCAVCHGLDHTEITHVRGRVSEKVCAACHAQIYQEAVLDAGHSYGPGPAGIGTNWDRNIKVPHYPQMPRKVMEMGCDPCHAQAGATDAPFWDEQKKQYVDLSSLPYRNGCIACHTRHRFDPAEARRAEACMTCHMGPDHPNWEAYSTSKHGAIYLTDGANWDWKKPMTEARYNAPTCAYCHMVYVDTDGRRTSSHNMTRKIIWGMGVQPALGELTDITRSPENQAKRAEMVKICLACHSEVKASEYLKAADAHKLMGDALVIQARDILHDLYRDKLLEPSRRSRSAGLLPGDRYVATETPGGTFWPAGLYYDVSAVEREYFDMFFFANLKSYKGAFHMSPDYAWWYGYAETLGHLTKVRDEAGRLREERRTADRTSFMLLTGPLMVLVVIGAVWGARSFLRRRRAGA